MNHTESSIQQACVTWFRASYPWAAKLLIHVKNEETGGASAGGIHKAEGVVAGAPDLLLLLPSGDQHYLGIEMKSERGRIRDTQLLFSTYIKAAAGQYVICRSLDAFIEIVRDYMSHVDPGIIKTLHLAFRAEDQARICKAREELKSISKPRRRNSKAAAREELRTILRGC